MGQNYHHVTSNCTNTILIHSSTHDGLEYGNLAIIEAIKHVEPEPKILIVFWK